MTVIAFDGKSLAGDRLGDFGGTPIIVRKVSKVKDRDGKDWLVGTSGNANCSRAWLAWFTGVLKDKPTPHDDFTALLVDRRGRMFQVDKTQHPLPIRFMERFYAIGIGRGEALGAMAMGASAREAVQISARFNVSVGNGVDVVRF